MMTVDFDIIAKAIGFMLGISLIGQACIHLVLMIIEKQDNEERD